MRHQSRVLISLLTSLTIACQRDKTNSVQPTLVSATNPSTAATPNPPPVLAVPEDPYAPQEIAWQDIWLGMTEKEYLKCIRPKISGEPKNTWEDDGTIKTLNGKRYVRIELHDHEGKQDRVLDNRVPDGLFGELPSHRIFLTDEPVTHSDYLETYDTPNKSPLIQSAAATFVSDRLIVFRLEIKPSIVSKEDAQSKFEQKYQRRFEPAQIMTYRMPDRLIISPINCLVLRKNSCSICLNQGSTEFLSSGYYIQIQDDFRIKELQEKSKVMIAKLRKQIEASEKAKSDAIKF